MGEFIKTAGTSCQRSTSYFEIGLTYHYLLLSTNDRNANANRLLYQLVRIRPLEVHAP